MVISDDHARVTSIGPHVDKIIGQPVENIWYLTFSTKCRRVQYNKPPQFCIVWLMYIIYTIYIYIYIYTKYIVYSIIVGRSVVPFDRHEDVCATTDGIRTDKGQREVIVTTTEVCRLESEMFPGSHAKFNPLKPWPQCVRRCIVWCVRW